MPQRRFAHDEERQAAVAGPQERGLDPAPELELGAHCAELYVSRPPGAPRVTPISGILGPLPAG